MLRLLQVIKIPHYLDSKLAENNRVIRIFSAFKNYIFFRIAVAVYSDGNPTFLKEITRQVHDADSASGVRNPCMPYRRLPSLSSRTECNQQEC